METDYAGSFFGATLGTDLSTFNQEIEFKIYVYSSPEGLELDV